jgi:Fe2+ transport system protein FeoA
VKLSDLPVGSAGIVRSVDQGAAGQGRRLREVGFVPGTVVRVERRAPLGDPTVYFVRSTRFALRRAGAELVDVDPVEQEPAR